MEITQNHTRLILMLSMLIMGILILADVIEDYEEGVTLGHLATEGVLLLISSTVFLFVTRSWLRDSFRVKKLEVSVSELKRERELLKSELQKHLQGLALVVDQQFKAWNLTLSEQEVGFLLLKGLSLKEIANLRNASEKTVQSQAQAIYKKSDLHNRSEFAAFFLEDLLPPKS